MTLPDFLRADEYGEIFLTGHRVTLYHVLTDYNEGYSPEMLVGVYPTLPLAVVHKVIAYYLENQADVDRHLEETRAELDRQEAAGRRVDVTALRARLEQMRKANRGSDAAAG